jgi:hypothetical protein
MKIFREGKEEKEEEEEEEEERGNGILEAEGIDSPEEQPPFHPFIYVFIHPLRGIWARSMTYIGIYRDIQTFPQEGEAT